MNMHHVLVHHHSWAIEFDTSYEYVLSVHRIYYCRLVPGQLFVCQSLRSKPRPWLCCSVHDLCGSRDQFGGT